MKYATLILGLILFFTVSSSHASTITWKSGSDGNWSDTSNWNPKHIPGSNDIAVITATGSYTVTLDTDADAGGLILGATDGNTQTLTLNGQTFTLAGQAMVNPGGQIDLTSGTFNGDTNNGGAMFSGLLSQAGGNLAGKWTFTTNSVLDLTTTNALTGLVALTNYGMVVWNATDLNGSSALEICNYGMWDAQTDLSTTSRTFYGNGTVFNNFGTFRKSAGLGTITLDSATTFNTSGTVDVGTATLWIQKGNGSGIFNIASNTWIYFSTPYTLTNKYTLVADSTFLGSGYVHGWLNVSNITLNGKITSVGTALMGPITIGTNATLNLMLGGEPTNTLAGALRNYGTVNWISGGVGYDLAEIDNYGLWDWQTNGTFSASSPTLTFNNYGVFRKSGGSDVSEIDPHTTFNNYGTADVQTGLLYFGPVADSGTINVATNSQVDFGYSCVLSGSPAFSGSGSTSGGLIGSNAVINGELNLVYHTVLLGVMSFGSNAVVNLMDEAGNNQLMNLAGLVLTNYGVVNWMSVGIWSSAPSTIYNYGLWDAQGYQGVVAASSMFTFNNYGVFQKSGGTNDPNVTSWDYDANTIFNNYGAVDVRTGWVFFGNATDSGTINVGSNSQVGFSYSCVLSGSPTFSGSGFTSGGLIGSNAMVNGELNLAYPITLSGAMSFGSNAVVNLTNVTGNNQFMYLAGLVLTNCGTVNWQDMAIQASSPSTICNYGLWDAQNNGGFLAPSSTLTFDNYGVFQKSGGTHDYGVTSWDYGTNTIFNNYGAVDVQTGWVFFGVATDSGTINVASNSLVDFSYSCVLSGNPAFSGSGFTRGGLIGSNAVINGEVTLIYSTGLSGTLTIGSNCVVNFTNGLDYNEPMNLAGVVLTNYGTVNWQDVDIQASSPSTICNYGLWDCQRDHTFIGSAGTPTVFNNYGLFQKSGGSAVTLYDNNTFFRNNGTADMETGQLSLGGFYLLTNGLLKFGVRGPANYGSAYLSGNAELTGGLIVNFTNGYSPAVGDAFNLLAYGSKTGNFSTLNLPHLSGGLIWQTNYGATIFSLMVTSAPPFLLTTAGISQNGDAFNFSFQAIEGQSYQVQSTTNLSSTNWINVGDPVTATNGWMTVSDLIGQDSRRFYRVVLQ